MDETVLNILLAPLAILIYVSGLLLWPIRRWRHRRRMVRGKMLLFVFIGQLVAYLTVACLSAFVRLEHFYYWLIFLIELNFVFTVAGVIAWVRDARYERKTEVDHVV